MSEKAEGTETREPGDEKPQAAKVEAQPPAQVPTPTAPAPTPNGADELKQAAEALLSGVPEHLKPLIPDVGPAEQIKWFRAAEATGVFNPPAVPATDAARPKSTVPEPDLSKLPPMARMSRGYGN